jgi:cytochrome b561
MAPLFGWQFLGMIAEATLGERPLVERIAGQHASVGMLILVLAAVRLAWAVASRRRRPREPGALGALARAGHLALYALMLLVPALALLRAFGSGRGVAFFGAELVAPTGQRIEALMAPANALHGPLAWALLALIAGHVLMVAVHRWVWRDDVLGRMAGSTAG